jgi:hypothetical protein
MNSASLDIRKKERTKIIRTTVEIIVFVIVAFLVYQAFYMQKKYKPYVDAPVSSDDKGFIAISYFGVEKFDAESKSLITDDRLDQHIKALKDSGYVTITQDDIIAYFKGEKQLPEKALFLIFEDGRRDSAVFAQNILEKNNFRATMLSYADRVELFNTKFLNTNDLKLLNKSSFWELGTNGYRLEYINVFDRYKNYFGRLNSYEFVAITKYLVRDYNHYLMDFIRDAEGIPLESLAEMKNRIAFDYMNMNNVYREKIGFLPQLYILMHSNTGQFGTHRLASNENEKWITDLFAINFNREGDSHNDRNASIFDLTRIQPQANWYTNHLLMRIWDDTGDDVAFISGDLKKKAKWDTITGQSEFAENKIILTSPPSDRGLMKLNESSMIDFDVSMKLEGNVAGSQGIYLRADEALANYIYVGLEKNKLVITSNENGAGEQENLNVDLFEFDGGSDFSVEEDKQQSLEAHADAVLKYSDDYLMIEDAKSDKKQLGKEIPPTIAEGADPYVPTIDLLDRDHRDLRIILSGNQLTVYVDNKIAAENVPVNISQPGNLILESAPIRDKFSQRNLADDVYDAVFTNMLVKWIGDSTIKPIVIYDNRLSSLEELNLVFRNIIRSVINFFIYNF